MKKICVLAGFLIFLAAAVNAGVVDMKGLSRPDNIVLDHKDIVITDGINIFIYSQKDKKPRNRFGKRGEGPQEFTISRNPWIPSIRVYLKPDQIFVSSMNKVVTFDREGRFITEFRPTVPGSQYIPLGEKYVVVWFANEKVQYITYTLYDGNRKMEKELTRIKSLDQGGKKINPIAIGVIKNLLYRQVYGDKIFIPTEGDVIHVFNESGKKIAVISPPYERVKITSKIIDEFARFYSNDIRFKDIFERDRNRIDYPDFYPLMKDYRVTRDRVYVVSHKKVDNKYETFIFDHQGKLQEKKLMPLVDADPLELYPFTFYNNRIYQLIEDEEAEIWQLHITEIK